MAAGPGSASAEAAVAPGAPMMGGMVGMQMMPAEQMTVPAGGAMAMAE